MRKSLRVSLLLIMIGLAASKISAQVDPHFSQYYVYPSWLNPALTGAFDGQYRVSGVYRNQWGNISSPFTTYGASAEFTTEKKLNLGVSVLKQTAGDGGYSYTTAYGNIAYTGVRFGKNEEHRVVFGMQAGIIQRRFDRNKMTFGDQWNPVFGFNPGTPSSDVLNRTNATAFDMGAGVLYFDAQPGKKANLYAGFSASHLTKPEDKFSATGDAKFPMRYTAHAGIRFTLSDRFSITPNFLYLSQGSATEKMAGAYGQYKATSDVNLMIGANYRFEDAISPFFGFTYKNMMLGASYDINSSDLGKLVNGSNSFEISLSIIGRKSTKTPEVEFVCPRL
ncbi:MAG: PorP/SprF family type IX secretion system membrane protein [Chitinophagaceae bacterium]|nr:PorP/SprF family type IX secretion system membrane protein [Chitinophagaceae bacterium]